MEQHSNIFSALDPMAAAFSAFVAVSISLIRTVKDRAAQQRQGAPLTPWSALLADALAGSLLGTLAGVGIPQLVERLHGFTGTASMAMLGGILGPKLVDALSSIDAGTIKNLLLDWLAKQLSGRVPEAPGEPPPPPAPQPAPPAAPPQGGDADVPQ